MAVLTERIRRPAVAGYFYPADAASLREAVRSRLPPECEAQRAVGLVVPHGSYAQCGRVLGAGWAAVEIPRRVVVLSPSHTPAGAVWSVAAPGAWRTPLGEVPVDAAAVDYLRWAYPGLGLDEEGQRGEHAIEVHLPFLQMLGPPQLTLTPITAPDERAATCAAVAEALVRFVRSSHEPVLLVASSDLSQFEPAARGRLVDGSLLGALCALETVRLRQVAESSEAVVCGLGAVSCVVEAARALGAQRGRLVASGGSEDAGGDPGSRTGYAAVVVA
jgi:AmmeMemoRadiSam system protein B